MLNQDVQATSQIISLLERSKANSEAILDRLPDIFVVLTDDGKVLKGNYEAARKFGVQIEHLLHANFASLFRAKTWEIFQLNMNEVAVGAPKQFELNTDADGAEEKIYHWSLSRLEAPGQHSEDKLFCLIGRDITLLRSYQKQLDNIFATIPLGIFTVQRGGRTGRASSAYTRWLLGRDDIADRSLKELLYDPSVEFMDAADRECWNNLFSCFGLSLYEFDMIFELLPKQFYYPLPKEFVAAQATTATSAAKAKGRYLGIKIQSITHDDRVSGLLIILEDRTALVEAEKRDEKSKLLEDQNLERALQIKRADPEVLSVILKDLRLLMSQCAEAILSRNDKAFSQCLHSVKGNARTAGFSTMIEMTHDLESEVSGSRPGAFDWQSIEFKFDEIRNEWNEIRSLITVMSELSGSDAEEALAGTGEGTDPSSMERPLAGLFAGFAHRKGDEDSKEFHQLAAAIQRLSKRPLVCLESYCRERTRSTAEQLKKRVKLTFDWKGMTIDEFYLPSLRVCLLHLINNAIDHGIEAPALRTQTGKSLVGLIRIGAYQAGERVVFSIEDDGAGFDLEAIRAKAAGKGMIPASKKLTDEETLALILLPGFSTTEKITNLSGRGIGLDAVKEIVERFGGTIKIYVTRSKGAGFQFSFPL